jgi:hypothetical protein
MVCKLVSALSGTLIPYDDQASQTVAPNMYCRIYNARGNSVWNV